MPDELITSENVSIELLKSVFDAAYMDCESKDNNALVVQEKFKIWVSVGRKTEIRFNTLFGFTEESSPITRLECVNTINSEYIMISTFVQEDSLWFRYDLAIDGGISRKALVKAVKRFGVIAAEAVTEHSQIIK